MRGFMVRYFWIRIDIVNVNRDALFSRSCFDKTKYIGFRKIGDFTPAAANTGNKELVDIIAFLARVMFDIRNGVRTVY